jgi:hypothetical protein
MTLDEKIYLMYHELGVPGRALCHREEGYTRYVVDRQIFSEQMSWLRSAGIRALSVTDALGKNAPSGVVITFDDGCESDLTVAAPLLKQNNSGATFYITVGFLGRPGFLVPAQVRELGDLGFDLGCHSMTHAYLTDLSPIELHKEIIEAKTRLEDIVGRPVRHFSCPGGSWNRRVSEVAKEAGYLSVATSRIASNRRTTSPFRLARIAVMRNTGLPEYQELCLGRGLWRRQLRSFTQATSRRLLGNSLYDRMRTALLERSSRAGLPPA